MRCAGIPWGAVLGVLEGSLLCSLWVVLQGSKLQPRAASSAIVVLCPLGKPWKKKEKRNPAWPPRAPCSHTGVKSLKHTCAYQACFNHGKCRR